jgi:acid phosphatase (class A)
MSYYLASLLKRNVKIMKLSLKHFAALLSLSLLAASVQAQVHYFPPGGFDAVPLLAPPPAPDSEEQAADLQMSREVVKARTDAETAKAKFDMTLSLYCFKDAIGPFFVHGKFPKMEAFFARIKKEIHAPIYNAKDFWKRPRPFKLDPSLYFGMPEESYSYPSGHSSVATVEALVLAELFPAQREAILAHGRQVGWDRVLTGYHFLTDVRAGRVLGQALFRTMMANPAFQHDLAEVKAEAAAAGQTSAR